MRKVCKVNNSVTFGRKPVGSDELLNRMIEALDVTIDRHPKKEDLVKWKARPLKKLKKNNIQRVQVKPCLLYHGLQKKRFNK